jgi:hypothetical protein
VVFTALVNGGGTRRFMEELAQALAQETAGLGVPELPQPLESSEGLPPLEAFEGVYETPPVLLSVTQKDGRLLADATPRGMVAAMSGLGAVTEAPLERVHAHGFTVQLGPIPLLVTFEPPDESGRCPFVYIGYRAHPRTG